MFNTLAYWEYVFVKIEHNYNIHICKTASKMLKILKCLPDTDIWSFLWTQTKRVIKFITRSKIIESFIPKDFQDFFLNW